MSVYGMSQRPMLGLTATSSSFPFDTKYVVCNPGSKVVLGAVTDDNSTSGSTRASGNANGYFGPNAPVSLSFNHAEVWLENGTIWIRDLDTGFGTYINDTKISGATALKTGDILTLGTKILRNQNTPKYITDAALKPVIATVSVFGTTN